MKNIAIVGLGTVGTGVYEKILLMESDDFKLKRIVVKDHHKLRPLGFEAFASTWEEVITDEAIDIVIELIDDEHFALQIARETLKGGKNLISGNKKMLAKHIGELQEIAHVQKVSLLYEAAVCGGIPIILLLQQYFLNNTPKRIRTIANGTSNYMLTKMWESKDSFQEILSAAQQAGFAEADPTDDLAGYDIRSKLVLMIWNAYNMHLQPELIACYGIQYLTDETVIFLKKKALKLKLVGEVVNKEQGLLAFVLPEIIGIKDTFYDVNDEQNIVEVENELSEQQLFQGKGAGRYPTTQAVLADLQAILSNRINSVNEQSFQLRGEEDQYIFYLNQAYNTETTEVKVLKVYANHSFISASFSVVKKLSEKLEDVFIAKISKTVFENNFV